MKQPDTQQLEQLIRLREYKYAVEYLQSLESGYISKLIDCEDVPTIHKLQGSITTIQTLLKLIHTPTR